ncbi:U-box domain-containing protein 5 isoform X2 [Rosa chinensis]|uniref:U-box domain-containing protein 5 isoform X2 n=1 Tax=Rosa chinensis TaxID=74649 RepID=UPI001AD8E265|nr:U-box domain-containing protein 5 isoform X2 [Rosa chinensis]
MALSFALDLIGGQVFELLSASVTRAVDRKAAFGDLLQDMKYTLKSLKRQAIVIQQIQEYNLELSLPNDEMIALVTQMTVGRQLVDMLSGIRFRLCNFCCINDLADQLKELNSSLESLFDNLQLEQVRDIKETLKLSRQNRDVLEKMKIMLEKIMQMIDDPEVKGLLKKLVEQNAGGSMKSSPSTSTLGSGSCTENEGNCETQVPSSKALVEAAFRVLLNVVIEVKESTIMFRPLLRRLKSTLDYLLPLIGDMVQCNKALDRPKEELENMRIQMENGVVLVGKCLNVRRWTRNKKYIYTNQLFELNDYLQEQLSILLVEIARDARETSVVIRNIKDMVKRDERSGMAENQLEYKGLICNVSEPPLPTVGLETNMQGTRDVMMETLVSVKNIEEGVKGMEGRIIDDVSETLSPIVGSEVLNMQGTKDVIKETQASTENTNPEVNLIEGRAEVHCSMCIQLWKLVERISKIFPDIEAARPRCSTGIQALCMLNRAIEKAKQLVQYCSESSKLYLALTGDVIVSRCQKSRNLLEQSLCQIQSWVPVILVAEISKIVDDLKAATFRLHPSEEEAGKVIRELLHQDASASNSIKDSEIKALQLASLRLHITTSKEVLVEKRSIKKLLQNVGDSDPRKKQILTYFLYLLKKYGNLILVKQTESSPVWQQGSLASENSGNDFGYNQCAEVEPHTGYGEYEAQSNMLLGAVPPQEFLCGISSRLMYDPVLIASGQTYERMWIQKWFDEGNDTCPKTNTKLAHLSLTPNVGMTELISRWCKKYGVTIPNPSMQPEALSSWENSSTSIASLGSSMNDLRLQMDLSTMSFGSLDTSFNSKTEDGSNLVQIDDDSLKYRSAKKCETDLEFLSNISELKWDSQRKAVEDVKNDLKRNPQASYAMSSKNFVEPLIKFLRDAYDQDDVEAQRDGFKLLSTFVSKNRNGIFYFGEDVYSLLVSSLDSEVKEEGLAIMEILSVHQDCRGNISSSGALTSILKLLDSQSRSIQGKALKILHNLSLDRDICSEMVSLECIPKLVPFFEDSALTGNCIAILKNLSDYEGARISIAETDGCIAYVIYVLDTGSKEHQEHAVDILLSLCSQRIDYCNLVMHEGVIPALVLSSTNGTERTRMNAMEVLRLLRDIDYDDEQESAEPETEAARDELPRDNGNHWNGKKASKASGFFGKKLSIFSKPSSLSPKKKE